MATVTSMTNTCATGKMTKSPINLIGQQDGGKQIAQIRDLVPTSQVGDSDMKTLHSPLLLLCMEISGT